MKPGIYANIPEEQYHAGPGVSKSMLWTLHTKTPAHLKYGQNESTAAMDIGKAIHCAILEPHRFETAFKCGPDDRRGNKWKSALDLILGETLLTSGEYAQVCAIRDSVVRNATISALVKPGAVIENSAYWMHYDPIELCRCRPDLYRPDIEVMLDVKTTTDASPRAFQQSVAKFGYHAQEAWYKYGWSKAQPGLLVRDFIFLVVEKTPPYAHALYQLDAESVNVGYNIMQQALSQYVSCKVEDKWPGYLPTVQPLSLPAWAFKEEN